MQHWRILILRNLIIITGDFDHNQSLWACVGFLWRNNFGFTGNIYIGICFIVRKEYLNFNFVFLFLFLFDLQFGSRWNFIW